MTSPFKLHVLKWKDCKKCPLYMCRKQVVFTRGTIPCKVLFIGEAPGQSEDVIGQPFIGPAGKLLDGIMAQAWPVKFADLPFAMTNLVGCLPLDDSNEKLAQPDAGDIKACRPKLLEFYNLCKPELVIAVGTLAKDWMPDEIKCKQIQITHPAALLRANIAQRDFLIRKCVVTLNNALEELIK